MFNLNELARAMINRLANDEIILNVSINVIVPLAGEKDIDFLTKEQKRELFNYARKKLYEDEDEEWERIYFYLDWYLQNEYFKENIEAFLEYEKKMNEPDFDWGFYSDWHKDMYGFRPR